MHQSDRLSHMLPTVADECQLESRSAQVPGAPFSRGGSLSVIEPVPPSDRLRAIPSCMHGKRVHATIFMPHLAVAAEHEIFLS